MILKWLVRHLEKRRKTSNRLAKTVKVFNRGKTFSNKILLSEREMSRRISWLRSINLWILSTIKRKRTSRSVKNMPRLCKAYLRSRKAHGADFRDNKSPKMKTLNKWKNILITHWAETKKISRNFIGGEHIVLFISNFIPFYTHLLQ